jgi:addiction module RelE/StbE family toxin
MTKYEVKPTSKFKKDYKLAKKRNLDLSLLKEVVSLLADGKPLPASYRDHTQVTGSTTESATFSRIGYWSIGMKMMFWFLL